MSEPKYTGKYTKCRTCKHVEFVGMRVVWGKSSCEGYRYLNPLGERMGTVENCQSCKKYEKAGDTP
jgi:hypothetical protein